MKKYIIPVLMALLLPVQQLSAAGSSDSLALQKACFTQAKSELESMLDGKKPLSYERAIFLIENAWWGNQLDYSQFALLIEKQTDRIRRMASARYDKPSFDSLNIMQLAQMNVRARAIAYNKALANWATFKFITDTTLYISEDSFYLHLPFQYSTSDPLGTGDWRNTQVSSLLYTKRGNCFALASLFRIFSERLHSDAWLCTAPGHIYIRHNDNNGTPYNIELGNGGSFPGTGTIETFTHITNEATMNNIALRDLNLKQSVALCLVYLAKGYEYKFGTKSDDFMLACAEKALGYDKLSLNAMLLKSEVLEAKLLATGKPVSALQSNAAFIAYQDWVTHVFSLGYREMPMEMKNLLLKGWTKDTTTKLFLTDHRLHNKYRTVSDTRYASLSWGVFDEEIRTLPVEQYGRTLFDTRTKTITAFIKDYKTYNDYSFDPVAFAWNVDPLAHKYPGISPYVFVNDNPIIFRDGTGAFIEGMDGKPVTYEMLKDGIHWSANASADTKRLGNAILKTATGREQMEKAAATAYPIGFHFDSPGDGHFGVTHTQGNFEKDGHFTVTRTDIYVNEKAMGMWNTGLHIAPKDIPIYLRDYTKALKTMDEGPGKKSNQYYILFNTGRMDDAIGAVGSHELEHATNAQNIQIAAEYKNRMHPNGNIDKDVETVTQEVEECDLLERLPQTQTTKTATAK